MNIDLNELRARVALIKCEPGSDYTAREETAYRLGHADAKYATEDLLRKLEPAAGLPDLVAAVSAHCDAAFEAYKAAERPLLDRHAQRTPLEHNTMLSRCLELERQYQAAAKVRRRLMLAMEAAIKLVHVNAQAEGGN